MEVISHSTYCVVREYAVTRWHGDASDEWCGANHTYSRKIHEMKREMRLEERSIVRYQARKLLSPLLCFIMSISRCQHPLSEIRGRLHSQLRPADKSSQFVHPSRYRPSLPSSAEVGKFFDQLSKFCRSGCVPTMDLRPEERTADVS